MYVDELVITNFGNDEICCTCNRFQILYIILLKWLVSPLSLSLFFTFMVLLYLLFMSEETTTLGKELTKLRDEYIAAAYEG